ncbi:MAG: chromosomal replication initiator protein DnaA [Thermoguttaceae bacterium]
MKTGNHDGDPPSKHAFFSHLRGLGREEILCDSDQDWCGEVARRGGRKVTKDDMEIVSALRTALVDKVGRERFDLWFGAAARLHWDGRTLTIGLTNRFLLDWVRQNFRAQIEGACMEVLGQCPALKFGVEAGVCEQGEPAAAAHAAARPAAAERKAQGAHEAPAEPGGNGAARPKFASLATFVTGQSNRLAFVSAEMVARSPGQISPLVIHGPTGVGKTHLLEGIWTAVRKSSRAASVVYVSAEQFTTQFVEALRGSGLPSFRHKYRDVQLLILDDLQFLSGNKRATQVELLHTIDALLRNGRQLVFSADRPLNELSGLGSELTTRLGSGMVCRVDPPDYSTRLGIVAQLAERLRVDAPPEVQRFVASRLTAHARELSGALCRLQATSRALGQEITLPLAEEALSDMLQSHSRVVRLADIQKAVCDVFGLEPAILQSDGKSKRVSHPRMLAMWLARKHTRAALGEIGQFFGRRSHSTVISAQKRVDGWMAVGEMMQLAERASDIDDAIRLVERQLAG